LCGSKRLSQMQFWRESVIQLSKPLLISGSKQDNLNLYRQERGSYRSIPFVES